MVLGSGPDARRAGGDVVALGEDHDRGVGGVVARGLEPLDRILPVQGEEDDVDLARVEALEGRLE